MSRATVIQALGLRTYLNELNAGEGALRLAENINIDEKGVITQRRGFNDFANSLPTASDRVKQVLEYKDRLLRHYNSTLQFDNGTQVFQDFSGTYEEVVPGLRMKSQEANGNLYFTSSSGIKKISALNSSQFTTAPNFITDSGVIKASDISAKVFPDEIGFIPEQSKVAYRVLFGYRDNNNNLLYGAPSARVVLTNSSKTLNISERSTITVNAYASILASQYILLSSMNNEYVLWFKVATTDEPPLEADTLGKNFIEVDIQGLSSNSTVSAAIGNALLSATSEFEIALLANVVTITAVQGGDTTNISGTVGGVVLATTLGGSITEGEKANAEVTFSVPSGATTDYFYQIYRTQVVSVVDGLLLSDIDPGDEMRLVYEEAITDTDISNGYVIVLDEIPQSFRNNGQDLYTNPISQEGILQANDAPPIAHDIELFGSSVFYSNTKSKHRLQFSLLSASAFTSGTSKFILGNNGSVREYTFIGTKEQSRITCGTFANTAQTSANNSYILLNSANNEYKYYLWFDKGTGVDPSISGRFGLRVNLTDLTGATAAQIAQRVHDTLLEVPDFDVTVNAAQVTITNINNGPSDNITTGTGVASTDIGTGWAVTVLTQGTGENAAANQVFLSSFPSSAIAIEETARSLVYVINQDALSPVNATYLSSENDLPGLMLFENRTLADNAFYVATNQFSTTTQFSPSLTETIAATSVTFLSGSGSAAKVTKTAHGLTSGTEVFLYSPDTTPSVIGKFVITVLDANNFTVPVNITVQDTAPSVAYYFLPSEVSDNLVSPNRVYFSKNNQPEAVPLVNFIDIGPKDEPIERILALRDNLFVFKTDGVYILSGTFAPNYSVRLLDNSTNIIAPDSAVVLNNQIYCLTTQGIATVSDTGVSILSRDIENLILDVTNARFNFKFKSFGVAYESDRAYFVWLPTLINDVVATQCYRYNIFEQTWTKWTVSATCGHVLKNDEKLYLGSGDRNYLMQERKGGNRTDFSDRDFPASIGPNALLNATVRLSSTVGIEKGDVLFQEQYITVSEFNRLLRKLDADKGLDSDYESSLLLPFGGNISQALTNLNDKLVLDDDSGIITPRVFSLNWELLQDQYNALINELNNGNCDTNLKNYKPVTTTTPYETIIVAVNYVQNIATVSHRVPFIEGALQVFKAIRTRIQWQPMHFGDPSGLKQVREATVLFDQNNFYSATLSFSTDLSQGLADVPFISKGVGYWGYGEFGGDTSYWGGEGNDAPFRTIVPLQKQRCRYLTFTYTHANAREKWRILGVSAVVRAVSSRAYR